MLYGTKRATRRWRLRKLGTEEAAIAVGLVDGGRMGQDRDGRRTCLGRPWRSRRRRWHGGQDGVMGTVQDWTASVLDCFLAALTTWRVWRRVAGPVRCKSAKKKSQSGRGDGRTLSPGWSSSTQSLGVVCWARQSRVDVVGVQEQQPERVRIGLQRRRATIKRLHA